METTVRLEESWKAALEPEFGSAYMGDLKRFLLEEKTEHRVERGDQRLVDVVLLACSVLRHRERHDDRHGQHDRDDLIELRRRLA